MGREFRRQGPFGPRRRGRASATARGETLQPPPLFLQEPAGLVLLAPQSSLLGLMKTAVLMQQMMLGPPRATTQIRFRVVPVLTQT